MNGYEHLSRDELEARLRAAEDVCVLFGWTPADYTSERGKAGHELWLIWGEISGNRCTPQENPHLTDELITEMAAKRDATRERTLKRIDELFGIVPR